MNVKKMKFYKETYRTYLVLRKKKKVDCSVKSIISFDRKQKYRKNEKTHDPEL